MDEFDRTIHPPISRSRPADFQPPRSNRSDSSEAKRRRYAVEAATFHSFDDHYPSRQQPIVGYSPIRRHSDNSYAAGSYSDPTSRRSTSQSNLPQITAAESRTHHRRQSSGNLDEFDLLHGELLDSDVEDEATVPSETKSGAL